MAFGKPPVIRPARKRTEFDYDFLSPEDRRRLEKPMVSLGKCNFKIFHFVECSSFFNTNWNGTSDNTYEL